MPARIACMRLLQERRYDAAFPGYPFRKEVQVESIRLPQVQDTVTIPDWELKE